MNIKLSPVTDAEHVEWLRVQRSRPELYKYFRQDAPLTPEQQSKWWRGLRKDRVRLFIIENEIGQRVGYVGFNPFNQYSMQSEFGMFILPEFQNSGYGKEALLELLFKGFTEYNLATIYSDVIDYPDENRYEFYANLGFEQYPYHSQGIRYMKQGKWVPSIKFFMTRDMWRSQYGDDNQRGLGHVGAKAIIGIIKRGRGRPARLGVHPSTDDIHAAAK